MIYLDNAATSWPKAPGVAEALAKAITDPVGNVGRSAHAPALAAAQLLFDCRQRLQSVMPPTDLEKTVFTRNATEALNMAILGTCLPGQVVLTTPVEHNAVARPLYHLSQRGVRLEFAQCDQFGRVDADAFRTQLLKTPIDLAVFTAANNVSGAINPLEDMVAACIEASVPFIIDGAQAVGEISLPVFPKDARGALCYSLHKGLLGPSGVGVMALYGDFSPQPLFYGGTGSRSDSEVQPEFLPDKYESGTPAIHAIAGSNAALTYVVNHLSEISEKREKATSVMWQALAELDLLRMLTSEGDRVALVSITVKDGTIGDLSRALYGQDIAMRAGYHCAPWTHRYLNTVDQGGAIRFSVGHTTTIDDIEKTVEAVKEEIYG